MTEKKGNKSSKKGKVQIKYYYDNVKIKNPKKHLLEES